MAKAARLGTVKSRLARDLGWVRATAFHRMSVVHLARRLGGAGAWETLIAIAPDGEARSAFPGLGPLGRLAQGHGDLGARMGRVMRDLPPGPVVIVGTDIPEMRPADIAAAFRQLGSAPAVLGPADDGGYWLVGLRRTPRRPEIFDRVRWSSRHTRADTEANIGAENVAHTRALTDVDDAASHRRLADAGSRVVLPPWWKPSA